MNELLYYYTKATGFFSFFLCSMDGLITNGQSLWTKKLIILICVLVYIYDYRDNFTSILF